MMSSFNPFTLEGKVIFVTGASSGIGRQIAINCSRMGATIILNGRNKERLQEVLKELENDNHQIAEGDITQKADISNIIASLPKLDGIVHCAGIDHRKPAKFMEEEDVNRVMGTNFAAPILLQSELLRQKKVKAGASIIFMSSMAANSPSMGHGLYSASKGALISYADCLALELAPRKIRVNCICPGMVWTKLILQDEVTEEERKKDEETYPLKRYGTPDDIANLAIYLLSDAASWVTSSHISITGGAR